MDPELLLVDVVDDADNRGRPAHEQRREERDPVLAVDHGVEAPAVGGEEGGRVGVQRIGAAPAMDTHAVDHLAGRRTLRT
jgi:hypothetical protein